MLSYQKSGAKDTNIYKMERLATLLNLILNQNARIISGPGESIHICRLINC
jgi:hypothetical protein